MAARSLKIPRVFGELIRPKARYRVFYGGRGAGRSWSFARVLLVKAARAPLRVLCTREYQSSIRDSVHALLCDQVGALELDAYYDLGKAEITSSVGSKIIFEGLHHNVTRIKSIEGIDICWTEEAEKISNESWDVLIPTIRKDESEIWVSFNPDQESDPTYQRFVVNPPENAIIRHTTWRDNPWFPEELRREKDYLYRVDPERADHIWEGHCRSWSDAQVLLGKWRVEAFEPNEKTWDGPYYGADWGFAKDPTTLMKVWIYQNTLYVEHEAYGIGVELDEIPAFFDRVPGARLHKIRADSSRPETIAHVRKRGFRVEAAPKWPGSVEDGIAFLRGFEDIIIHPRCRHSIDEAKAWQYKTDKLTGDVLPKLLDGHEHTWDGVRYALARLIQASKTILDYRKLTNM